MSMISIIEERKIKITQYLKNYIRKNRLQKGDPLPSENTLVEQFGANRNTVRSVYAMLRAQGIVYAKKGCGYFVAEKPKSLMYNYSSEIGFSENIQKQDETYENKIVNVSKRPMSAAEAKIFRIEEMGDVFVITTHRSINGKVFAMARQILPQCYVPALDIQMSNFHSLSELLTDKYGYAHPQCKRMTINALLPSAEEMRIMEVPQNTPMLKQTELFHVENVGYICYFVVIARGDMFKVEMDF